jgi:hypothetical protein
MPEEPRNDTTAPPPDDGAPFYDGSDDAAASRSGARSNGSKSTDSNRSSRPAEGDAGNAQRVVRLRSAAEIIAHPAKASWLIRGVLEQSVLAIVFGDLGTYKSFLALDWALHLAAGKAWLGGTFKARAACATVYVSAEGRGLDKRLRGWALFHDTDMKGLPFYAVEHLLDLSTADGINALLAAIEALGINPELIVIDTLSRNCGPLDESRSSDMAPFLNRLDELLRVRFGCTVLLVHHVGHGAKDRTRGSYALLANTDANYRVERPAPTEKIIKISTGRLKDVESHEPIYAMAKLVDLGTVDAEGDPESTLVLVPTHSRPQAPVRHHPTGKNQAALLTALQEWKRNHPDTDIVNSLELQAIGKTHHLPRKRLQEAVEGLSKFGWIIPCVGGFRFLAETEARS